MIIAMMTMTRGAQLLWTMIDVAPNHVIYADNQDAELDDERIEIWREGAINCIQILCFGVRKSDEF